MRLVKFTRLAPNFFFEIDNGRMAAAPSHRDAGLRCSSLSTPYSLTAGGAVPFHLAPKFDRRIIPYHSIEQRCASQQNQTARSEIVKADLQAMSIARVIFIP